MILKLLVQPRRGWTSHLFQRALDVQQRATSYTCLYSGPHGLTVPVHNYAIVILAASGNGILAQLPYLQQLIRGYDNFASKTRRIRLVWQLEHIGALFLYSALSILTAVEAEGASMKEFLNNALVVDAMKDGYVGHLAFYTGFLVT